MSLFTAPNATHLTSKKQNIITSSRLAIWAILISISSSFVSSCSIANEVAKGERPTWVTDVEAKALPKKMDPFVSGGIAYHLFEEQVHWRPDGHEYFRRYVYKVLDRSGLEQAANISFSFDPSRTTTRLNSIKIHRDGRATDRLQETELTIYRAEERLDYGILDGRLNVHAEIDDVRIGDVVEYSYSGTVVSELWLGQFFDEAPFSWNIPVGRVVYKLNWPNDRKIHFLSFNDVPDPKIQKGGEFTHYTWDLINPPLIQIEGGAPSWHVQGAHLSISSFGEWQEIQDWAEPIYAKESHLPKGFQRKVRKIKKKFKSKEDRLTEALRLVQNDIRYVAVSVGIGSHVPRSHEDVIESGFGDCKDKSWLLVTILRELEIEAWPALANLDNGIGLDTFLPSIFAFDHMIVMAKINNDVYWLDPTLSHQGGRGQSLTKYDYGFALPVGSPFLGLQETELPPLTGLTENITENFYFHQPEAGTEETYLTMTFREEYAKHRADGQRRYIATTSADDINKGYLGYYQNIIPGIEAVGELKISDNLDKNEITIEGKFQLSNEQAENQGTGAGIYLMAYGYDSVFSSITGSERKSPIQLLTGINKRHRINIEVKGGRPNTLENVELALDGLYFSAKFEAKGERLSATYSLQSNRRHASAEEMEDYNSFVATIEGNNSIEFTVNNVEKSLVVALNLQDTDFEKYEERIIETHQHISEKNYIAALEAITSMLGKHTSDDKLKGYLLLVQAEVFVALKRKNKARKAYEKGLRLYEDYMRGYLWLMTMYLGEHDYERGVEYFVTIIGKYPEFLEKFPEKSLGALQRELDTAGTTGLFPKIAIAIANADLSVKKRIRWQWIYAEAVRAHVKNSDLVQAKSTLLKITDPNILLSFLSDKRFQDIWPSIEALAGPNFSSTIENSVALAREEYEKNDEDFQLVLNYAIALRTQGRESAASNLLKPFAEDLKRIELNGEPGYWLVNEYASSLIAQNRFDEGIEFLTKVIALGVDDYPSLVNMQINRAVWYLDAGKFQEAFDVASSIDTDLSSNYGDMFIFYVQACSLENLGREQESLHVLMEMLTQPESNNTALLNALLCAGDLDHARDIMINLLYDPESRDFALEKFQRGLISSHLPEFRRKQRDLLRELLSNPKVQDVFTQYGRALEIQGSELFWH